MATIDNLEYTLDIPGHIPMSVVVRYWLEVKQTMDDEGRAELDVTPHLGCLEISMGGKLVAELEGKGHIPAVLWDMAISKIPTTPASILWQALEAEEGARVDEREHAVGI